MTVAAPPVLIEVDEPVEAPIPVRREAGGSPAFRIVSWAFIGLLTLFFFFPLLMLMRAGPRLRPRLSVMMSSVVITLT